VVEVGRQRRGFGSGEFLIEKYSDTPFCVRPISPAISALLFDGSSQDCVPGMKVAYNALPYFSASIVSFELIVTCWFSSTILPPNAHTSQWQYALPSPTACPVVKPAGWPLFFSFWQRSRSLSVSVGTPS